MGILNLLFNKNQNQMKKINALCLTIILLTAWQFLSAQPYQIGKTSTIYIDTSRNNRNIDVDIYYPADIGGTNVPLATGVAKFPVLAFGHGFVMVWSAYQNVWSAIVPEGYVMIFPKTENGFSPSHTEFAKDIAFCIGRFQLENTSTQSIFYQRLDSTSAAMGHSMGGGSSLLAMQYNSNITAVCNLAAAETNPSAVTACGAIAKPALLLSGGNDCITPPPAHQDLMYNALTSSCKTILSINGASHCQFADYNFNCSFGELTCTPQPAISRNEQHSIMNQYMIPWLNYILKNDCSAGNLFQQMIDTASALTHNTNCSFCPTSIENQNQASNNFVEIFVDENKNISLSNKRNIEVELEIKIFNTNGNLVHSQEASMGRGEILSLLNNWNNGTYIVMVNDQKGRGRFSKIVILQ